MGAWIHFLKHKKRPPGFPGVGTRLVLFRRFADEFQGVFQGGQVLFMPLKLVGHHAPIARVFQDGQAFADGHHAVASHSAPDIIAVAGMDPAVAGIVVRVGFEDEILHANNLSSFEEFSAYD